MKCKFYEWQIIKVIQLRKYISYSHRLIHCIFQRGILFEVQWLNFTACFYLYFHVHTREIPIFHKRLPGAEITVKFDSPAYLASKTGEIWTIK